MEPRFRGATLGLAMLGKVAVVGAGPVGCVAALAAVQSGFAVTLIDKLGEFSQEPRASTTHPSTLELLARLGLVDQFIREGLVARTVEYWDRRTMMKVAEFDHAVLNRDTRFPFVVQTEQHKLVRMILGRLGGDPGCELLLGTEVVGLQISETKVDIRIRSARGDGWIDADYVIGCDGAHSIVRRELGASFDGFTWPESFLVVTTPDPIGEAIGCAYRSYFADPVEWANLFKVAGETMSGLWRVVFPTKLKETVDRDRVREAALTRTARLCPALQPIALADARIYQVHQRVASVYGSTRVVICGDAAHVNNPIGGLGLNSGIHDVMAVIPNLAHYVRTGDREGLNRAILRRREVSVKFVQEQTIRNKQRLEESDAEKREATFADLRMAASSPERARQFLRHTALLDSYPAVDGLPPAGPESTDQRTQVDCM